MSKTTDAIAYAFELLFPKEVATGKLFTDFKKFCDRSISSSEVAVLYEGARDFREFTQNHNVMIGRKEVIISLDGQLKYAEDYSSFPTTVIKKDGKFYEVVHGWDGSTRLKLVKY